MEIIVFSDCYSEFIVLDMEVVGIFVDSEFLYLVWIQIEWKMGGIGNINYFLVLDFKKEIS